jgi:hypothetical protein
MGGLSYQGRGSSGESLLLKKHPQMPVHGIRVLLQGPVGASGQDLETEPGKGAGHLPAALRRNQAVPVPGQDQNREVPVGMMAGRMIEKHGGEDTKPGLRLYPAQVVEPATGSPA